MSKSCDFVELGPAMTDHYSLRGLSATSFTEESMCLQGTHDKYEAQTQRDLCV